MTAIHGLNHHTPPSPSTTPSLNRNSRHQNITSLVAKEKLATGKDSSDLAQVALRAAILFALYAMAGFGVYVAFTALGAPHILAVALGTPCVLFASWELIEVIRNCFDKLLPQG